MTVRRSKKFDGGPVSERFTGAHSVHGIARREQPVCACPDRAGWERWFAEGCPVHGAAEGASRGVEALLHGRCPVPAPRAKATRPVAPPRPVVRGPSRCRGCGELGHNRRTCPVVASGAA